MDQILLTTGELRALLIEWLREARAKSPSNPLKFPHLFTGVQHLYAKKHGLEAQLQARQWSFDQRNRPLFRQVVWDLILERVMVPGSDLDDGKSDWPYLTLTDHGGKVVENAGPTPYDPDGYLKRIKEASPIHPTALRYLQESLATFKSGNQLASVVMLGAASEWIVNELAQSIAASMVAGRTRSKFESRALKGKMAGQIRAVVDWCRNHKPQLCGEWTRNEQVEVVDQLATFIRKRRNDAGHPQDPPAVPSHQEMHGWLVLFPTYCMPLYELKVFLDGKTGSIT